MRIRHKVNPVTGAMTKTVIYDDRTEVWVCPKLVNNIYPEADFKLVETFDKAEIAKRASADYFHGVAPSDLKDLDSHELHVASQRLYDSVSSGVGTPDELAGASEAYAETQREAGRRRQSLHND